MEFVIYNFHLDQWKIIELFALGYKLSFDGIIDKVCDPETFVEALKRGLRVTKIVNGMYLTDDILELCTHLTHLNLNENPYATRLGPSASILEELYCCGSSGIGQDQIDLCINLKCLHIDDNPNVVMCHSENLITLSIVGNCKMSWDFVNTLVNLRDLRVSLRKEINALPKWITKLHLVGLYKSHNVLNGEHLKWLEVDDSGARIVLGPELKTLKIFAIEGCSGHVKLLNLPSTINIETLILKYGFIDTSHMINLKHLEMRDVNFDDIPVPGILETLKVYKIAGESITNITKEELREYEYGELSDDSSDDNSNSDTEHVSDKRVKICDFKRFVNLRTLHVDSDICTVKTRNKYSYRRISMLQVGWMFNWN